MAQFISSAFFILFGVFSGAASRSLNDYLSSQLSAYELLDPVKIISKRSLGDDSSQQLEFHVLNQTLRLVLHQVYSGTAAAPGSLMVQVMRADGGGLRPYDASGVFADFYSGYVQGAPHSRVSGYRDGGSLHLTIDDGEQVLSIEPVSLLSSNQSDNRLVAYYDDSIKGGEHFCGSVSAATSSTAGFGSEMPAPTPMLTPLPRLLNHPRGHRQRRRRSLTSSQQQPSRVCRMQLVADHTFVRRIASGSVASTVKCLIKIADDINAIYLGTQFVHPHTGEVFTGIGFELTNVVVLEKAAETYWPNVHQHFNAPVESGQSQFASHYLEAFGDYEQNGLDLGSYCLNHLVTFRPMQQNILGLAYLGSALPGNIGGVCSMPSYSTYGRQRSIGRNIGFGTYANKDGDPILSRQALLVSAHELGHNMGAEHDMPDTACTPAWRDGGPYLMYQIAVTGSAEHHSHFSVCSRKQIAVVIKARLEGCFQSPRGSLCGNRKQERDEECDAGSLGDACCTGGCRLRPGAACSDANSPCCRRCRPADASLLCLRQSPLHPCQNDTYCNGQDTGCPQPASVPNGTPCQFGVGTCVNGSCESVCSRLGAGHRPCACASPASAVCLVCCQDAAGRCSVYSGPDGRQDSVRLPANQPCPGGRCLANGTCQELRLGSGQLIVRLWDLITQSGSNSVATFLWKNIVFTVVFLSLLLWVPACAIIAFQDRLDAKRARARSDDQQASMRVAGDSEKFSNRAPAAHS